MDFGRFCVRGADLAALRLLRVLQRGGVSGGSSAPSFAAALFDTPGGDVPGRSCVTCPRCSGGEHTLFLSRAGWEGARVVWAEWPVGRAGGWCCRRVVQEHPAVLELGVTKHEALASRLIS